MSADKQTASGRTVLAVTGMTCATCVRVVTSALSRVPGVDGVEVDLDTAGPSSRGWPVPTRSSPRSRRPATTHSPRSTGVGRT
jgi:cation transport ATPase